MNDNTPQNQNAAHRPDQDMQEQLCAYLFDELEPGDRSHVEARLAESETWRTEHDRLKSTIGLVETTLKAKSDDGSNALSAASMETLAAAAQVGVSGTSDLSEASGGGSVHSFPAAKSMASPMRLFAPIAAGLAVTFGGVLAWKAIEDRDGLPGGEVEHSASYEPMADAANSEMKAAFDGINEGLSKANERKRMAGLSLSEAPDEESVPTESRFAEKSASAQTKGTYKGPSDTVPPGGGNTRPIYDIQHTGEVIVQREVLQDPNRQEGALPLEKAKQRLSAIARDMPKSKQGFVEDPLMISMDEIEDMEGGEAWLLSRGTGSPDATTAGTPQGKVLHVSVPQTETAYAPGALAPGTGGGPATPGPASPAPPASSAPGNKSNLGLPSTPNTRTAPPAKQPAPAEVDADEDAVSLGYFHDDGEDERLGDKMEELYDEAKRDRQRRFDQDTKDEAGRFGRRAQEETPEQLERRLRASMEARAKSRCDQIIVSCVPKPQERPRDMYFRYWGDNPFVYTSTDKLATFAADVDTASYTLARRYLVENLVPTKAQIRTEEFVNYFAGDIPAPTEDVFAVQTEASVSPFGGSPNRYMLRVGVRGKEIAKENRPPMSLVFVVDTSGSMDQGNRMELVKHSLRLLGTELDARDQVGIVSFADTASLVLPMTSMDQRATLESAIQGLSPEGSTNVEDGMRLGYELLARVPAEPGKLRRVVLISDGVANTGQTTADAILAQVDVHQKAGIYLSTVGVGMGNHNDALLERLANRGNGICDYVDDEQAARRAMVDRFSGGFIPIARDLKIQVEFDGQYVLRYRQLGYENRAVADKDFRNDAVDGGEVGSGHQVTALFELDCVEMPQGETLTALELGKVRLRYKTVHTGSDEQVFETEHAIAGQTWNQAMDAAQPGFQRAVVAAQFAEVLRKSTHAANDDFAHLVKESQRIADLPAFAGDADTQELRDMIQRAGALGVGQKTRLTELERTVDQYKKHRFLCATQRELHGPHSSERLEEIARLNAELESRIQELCLQEALQGR